MPYNKRGRGGYNRNGGRYMRKYYKGKYRRDPLTYGRMGQKVFDDTSWLVNKVAQLSSLINTEFKTADTAGTSTLTTVPIIALLNGLGIGDDFNNRDGRQVRWKSVEIKIQFLLSTAGPIEDMVRIMVVIDKQPNETLMVIADLLDTTTVQSMKNLNQRKRFVILLDTVIELSLAQRTNAFWKYYKKIDMKTIYDSSDTGGITDIETNAFYLVLFCTEAVNGIVSERTTRMRFIDN